MMLDNYDLASIVAIARREAKLSQSELAKRIGSSRQTISQIENAKCDSVSYGTIKNVCDALGYELNVQRTLIPAVINLYGENSSDA